MAGANRLVMSILRLVFLLLLAWVSGRPLVGQVVCPAADFVNVRSIDFTQGTVFRGLDRRGAGEYDAVPFLRRAPFTQGESIPNFVPVAVGCLPAPGVAGNITEPNPPLGRASTEILFVPDAGNGSSFAAWTVFRGDTLWVFEGDENRTLARRTEYEILGRRTGVLAGDYDGDQVLDLAVLNVQVPGPEDGGRIAILKGAGDGTFSPPTFVEGLPNDLRGFAQEDIDGNGSLDFVVATGNRGQLVTMLGDGQGGFQQGAVIEQGFPESVTLVDVNGDQRLDIVSVGGAVNVFLGAANGTFGAPLTTEVGPTQAYVATADLNGNGRLDLIVSHFVDNAISVLPGNGDGTFGDPTSYSVGRSPLGLFVVDFNDDGHLDIATGEGTPDGMTGNDSGIFAVLLGRGDLSFVAAPAVLQSRDIRGFAAADFNGDGRVDLAMDSAPSIAVQLQRANGTFERTLAAAGGGVESLAAADFNGDGAMDLAGGDRNRGLVTLLGRGDGTFQPAAAMRLGAIRATQLTTGDFTGEGNEDVLFAVGGSDPGILLLDGNGDGGFGLNGLVSVGVAPASVTGADVNGNGRLDAVVADAGAGFGDTAQVGGLFVLVSGTNGTFGAPVRLPVDASVRSVTAGDVNGDGAIDLVTSWQGENFSWFWGALLNDGNGGFSAPVPHETGFGPGQIAIADFNEDGRADVSLIHCCGDVEMGLILGNGDGTFQAEMPFPGGGDPFRQTAVDMNGDGRTDLAIAGRHGVAVLVNNSPAPPAFANVSAASFFVGPVAPDSIVSAFGTNLATATEVATVLPLPVDLAGTSATLRDSTGAEFPIALFFVSPGQVNYLMPAGVAPGAAVVTISSGNGATVQEAAVEIAPVAPGVFVLNSDAIAAALLLRVAPDGTQTVEQIVEVVGGVLEAKPIDFGSSGDRLFLLLFGTGLRSAGTVNLRVDGLFLPVSFVGPQGSFAGLDQVNAELLPELAGRGDVSVEVLADSIAANVTKLVFR